MVKNITTIRVRYADTDKMQFVYNGKYFEYFEVGRTEMLRAFGLPYVELEKAGYQLPLIEGGVKFFIPALYDDVLEIEAMVKEIHSPKVHIEYRVTRSNGEELIAEGFTIHVFMKTDTKKAARPPKIYIDSFSPHFNT